VNEALIGSIIAAVIAALGTYLLAARRFSGKIATSEANQLWKEAAAIREDCRKQVTELRAYVVSLEALIQTLREELRRGNPT
jgi:uncharacterized protein YqfA (UPF0365 family)